MDIFSTIVNFINSIGTFLGINMLMLISLALLVLVIIIQIFVVKLSLETKTAKSIKKIEKYLEDHPFISNENIVEFNRLMKKIPKTMRVRWQKYVVNKDKKPSDFMTEEECIEKPFKTGGIAQVISQFKSFLIILSAVAFIFALGTIQTDKILNVILEASFIPAVLLVIGFIYIIILKAVQSALKKRMYVDFTSMINLLDRAVSTFPDFVDYEILFTRKEIDAMIPELQEYLRLRALKEQEELERAKQNEVEHEEYDFSALGVDGALVMERAIKECEFYLGNRRKALSQIEQLQSEKDLLTKSYDEKNKNSQRKLRDINETLERFREKLNSTTNKIVGNDIRRQQAEEIKKQQNLEREIEEDNNRYLEELKKIDDQIAAKKEDINSERKNIEIAFNSEFKAYADKVYNGLSSTVYETAEQKVNEVNIENQNLKQELEDRDQYIAEKNVLFNEKVEELENCKNQIESMKNTISQYEEYRTQAENYMNEKDKEIEKKNQEIFSINSNNENLKKNLNIQEKKYKELRKQKFREITRYFDASGNEFFYDEDGMPFFYNEYGEKVYYNRTMDNKSQQQEVKLAEDYREDAKDENLKETDLNLTEIKENQTNETQELSEVYENEDTAKTEEDVEEIKLTEDNFEDLEELFNSQEIEESKENIEENGEIEDRAGDTENKISNPDEELKDLKAAIDAEIEKLNEEHDKLKEDIKNVSKQAEIKVESTPKEKKVSSVKKTTKSKSQAKKGASKKSSKKATANNPVKTIRRNNETIAENKQNETTKNETVKTPSILKNQSNKNSAKASTTKAKNTPSRKKSTSSKSANSAKNTKSKTNNTVTKKSTAKSTAPKIKKVEEIEIDNNVNMGIEDFGKELSTALNEANKNNKKK